MPSPPAGDLAGVREAGDPTPSALPAATIPAAKNSATNASQAAPSAPARPIAPAAVTEASVVTTPGGGKPIDLGPTLREALANQPTMRIESAAELHAALENEARDDSWSYPLEAEIRNSLSGIEQIDAVTVHTVECRSTLCEVRLSTYDYNFKVLHDWNQSVGAYPWIRRATPVTMMMPRANGRLEMLLILRRAPPSAASN
jgi:hypothetical protein